MRSIDWPSIWDQRGPLQPPVTLGFWAPCKKHRLKIAKTNELQHMIIFLCQDCDWVLVCRRVLLRHIIAGTVSWDQDVLYRAWNSEGENT